MSLGAVRVPEAASMHRASVLAASRAWTWSWGQSHVGQGHQAGVRAAAAAQPVCPSWPQHPQGVSLAEAQLSRARGQMVAQRLPLTGRQQMQVRESPSRASLSPPVLQSPGSPWRLGRQAWRGWLLHTVLGLWLPAGTHCVCHELEHRLVQAEPVRGQPRGQWPGLWLHLCPS